jgi:hypothetical protein
VVTGTLLVDHDPRQPYLRVTLALGDGQEVAFCDPRRFETGGARRVLRHRPATSRSAGR